MTAADRLLLTLLRARAREWASLRAWHGRCVNARVEVRGPHQRLMGLARPVAGAIDIYLRPGERPAEALGTLLHELAHVAAGAAVGHGVPWRQIFSDAVEEVTGCRLEARTCRAVLDHQAVSALASAALTETP